MDVQAQEQWAREMRLNFSPPAMLNEDGAIKQDFFKPAQVLTQQMCLCLIK